MFFTVAIAVCLAGMPFESCGKETAAAWILAPEQPASPSGCMIHGMQYAARSNLVSTGSYAKIFCTAAPLTGAAAAQLGSLPAD